jgi:hypothetical protein
MMRGLSHANQAWKREAERRQLREDHRELPSRWAGYRRTPCGLIIIGGQSLGTVNGVTAYGIEKFAGTLTGIPDLSYHPGEVDPETGAETTGPTPGITAWTSGLGYATAWDEDGFWRVIVCNDSRGGCANLLKGGESDDTTYVSSGRQVTVMSSREIATLLASGNYLDCWSPDVG